MKVAGEFESGSVDVEARGAVRRYVGGNRPLIDLARTELGMIEGSSVGTEVVNDVGVQTGTGNQQQGTGQDELTQHDGFTCDPDNGFLYQSSVTARGFA
jgi:hypothetical protein